MEENGKKQERLLAIVGRPNVGKSALFNRLVRRRMAIVHSEEGVTRDRLVAPAEWLGQRFRVIDTGGLALMDGAKEGSDAFQAATAAQVRVAIEDAAATIIIGITPVIATAVHSTAQMVVYIPTLIRSLAFKRLLFSISITPFLFDLYIFQF